MIPTLLLGCGEPAPQRRPEPEPPAAVVPAEDWSRDLVATDLALDLDSGAGTAVITLAPSSRPHASFEIGDLEIHEVSGPDGPLPWRVVDGGLASAAPGRRLDVVAPTGPDPAVVQVDYTFAPHPDFDGWMPQRGVTLLWPYFCGNLFPCRSDPADGLRFTLDVTGGDGVLVYPREIPSDAPSYQPAIASGDYTELDLGRTAAGTRVTAWALPGDEAATRRGTRNLVAVVDFFERTLGPYRFGDHLGTVGVSWGPGGLGGMEHHPFWHVASGAVGDEEVQAHEAAHGWFGDGVRLRCWEDFVLSEGTASYLAARALEQVGGTDVWPEYADWLRYSCRHYAPTAAWPPTCGAIDLLNDPLWSGIPYMQGACFYEDVADRIGPERVDRALAAVYAAKGGHAASMADVVLALRAEAPGEEAAIDALVADWLTGPECPADAVQRCRTHVPHERPSLP